MLHITDAIVDSLLTSRAAQEVLLAAFTSLARGDAAMQKRIRTQAEGVKLSTLGAVIPDQDIVGAKVYTTVSGQFSFVILLFSALDGRPLATLDAGAVTRIRTAACTVLAAKQLARSNSSSLGLFGVGVQGIEHAIQLAEQFNLREILVSDRHTSPDLAQRLNLATGVKVRFASAQEIAGASDIIVTASRSRLPLFEGRHLQDGMFIAAIGSSLPNTRELDDDVLARSRAVVVEWQEQTLAEAGDILLATPAALRPEKIVELADVIVTQKVARESAQDIFVYKSVGIGLEDIAVAGLAYRLLVRKRGP